jgi:hypothetical protein
VAPQPEGLADLIGAHPFFADHRAKAAREIPLVELV